MSNLDELRDTITAIIYGADWKEQDIADAFKPDVEAAMNLFSHYLEQETLKARIAELNLMNIDGAIFKRRGELIAQLTTHQSKENV